MKRAHPRSKPATGRQSENRASASALAGVVIAAIAGPASAHVPAAGTDIAAPPVKERVAAIRERAARLVNEGRQPAPALRDLLAQQKEGEPGWKKWRNE